jgi:hypothetical protein
MVAFRLTRKQNRLELQQKPSLVLVLRVLTKAMLEHPLYDEEDLTADVWARNTQDKHIIHSILFLIYEICIVDHNDHKSLWHVYQ